jgi:y4mF family transcriptional regulator
MIVDIGASQPKKEPMLLRTASDIGPLLRDARRKRGWTQRELSEAVGVSRAWVSMVENGKTSVEFDLVIGAFHALGYSASVQPAITEASAEPGQRTQLTRSEKPLRSRRVNPGAAPS